MAELPTFQEVYDAGRTELQRRRPTLTDFVEGSVNDAFVGSGATMADEVLAVIVEAVREQFFATAEGDALDRLAIDRLNLPRLQDNPAAGEVQWTRDAAGAYTVPEDFVFEIVVNGVTLTFSSTAAVSFLASDTTLDIPVVCSTVGPDGNVPAGSSGWTKVSAFASDPDATIAASAAMAGGRLRETDEQFRLRIKSYLPSIARGTVGALRFASLSVNGVTIATVVEDFDDDIVYVYIGDPDASASDPLIDLVTVALDEWRAAGVRVQVLAAAAETVTITLALVVPAGTDQATTTANVRAAVEAYAQALGAGQTAYCSQIECEAHDAVEAVLSAQVTLVDAVAPTGIGIAPSIPQNAIRIPAGNIAVAYTEV